MSGERGADRAARIRVALEQAFAPVELEVVDEGHRHVGHPGARDGRGHFAVCIVSDAFADLPLLQRHRAVYAALGPLMEEEIHALSVDARTPGEVPGR
ncbi:MAG TPA: BolA family protein [Xanthomonadaceae bacterium]|nr:BolA family protein [Xanthomonadaceae bacterium]